MFRILKIDFVYYVLIDQPDMYTHTCTLWLRRGEGWYVHCRRPLHQVGGALKAIDTVHSLLSGLSAKVLLEISFLHVLQYYHDLRRTYTQTNTHTHTSIPGSSLDKSIHFVLFNLFIVIIIIFS